MKVFDCFAMPTEMKVEASEGFVILECPDWWAMIPVHDSCCVFCIASRIQLATEPEKVSMALKRRGAGYDISPLEFAYQMQIIFDDWHRWLLREQSEPGRNAGMKWLQIDPADLSVSTHTAVQDPHCTSCSLLLPDAPWELPENFWEIKRLGRKSRGREIAPLQEDLAAEFVDSSSGLIHRLERGTFGGMAVSGAFLKFRREQWVDGGFGRTHDFRSAQAIAILEALERYSGVTPGGKTTQIVASFSDLGEQAVDPRIFGQHEQELYSDTASGYSRFDVNQKYRWVWAYELTQNRKVLVPEQLAYYFVPARNDSPLFAFEVSNGCALGGSLAEAIYYGLFEVIERDAFLLTWYRGIQIPLIEIPENGFGLLWAEIRRFELMTGMKIEFYDCTTDNGIPAVFGLAYSEEGQGLPAACCGAGVGTTLGAAIMSALSEMLPFATDFVERFPSEEQRASVLASDFQKVRQMKDHSALFADPRMLKYLEFLRSSDQRVVLEKSEDPPVLGDSFEAGLALLADRFRSLGQRVFIVDQTTPEIAGWNLRCVKVLASGSVPMTFGHHLRRVRGLPRLIDPPSSMGIPTVALEEMGQVPHPFP